MSFRPDFEPVYGADITLAGGGQSDSTIAVDSFNNGSRHTWVYEVDGDGAVVFDNGYQRIPLEDHGEYGLMVMRGINDNPELKPGESLDVWVGSHLVHILANAEQGVTYNGQLARTIPSGRDELRYPTPEKV